MPTTLAMNLPFGAVLVAANESLKDTLGLDEAPDTKSTLPLYFVSAGVSGALAAAATHPLDVVKTRLQTQDCLACDNPGYRWPKYGGFFGTVREIVRTEGVAALSRGMLPRILYTMPAAAICWGT